MELPNIGFFAQPGVAGRRAARLAEQLAAQKQARESRASTAASVVAGGGELQPLEAALRRAANGAQLCADTEAGAAGLSVAALVDYLYRALDACPDGVLQEAAAGGDGAPLPFTEALVERAVSAIGHLAMRPKAPRSGAAAVGGRAAAAAATSDSASASLASPALPGLFRQRSGQGYGNPGGLHVDRAPATAVGGRHTRSLLDGHAVQAGA
jgi:hypothetical protein